MRETVKQVNKMKIGYLGPKGTFSHEALLKYSKDLDYHAVDYSSIPELLLAVQAGELDEAIAPIENSIEGAVNATLDFMASEAELRIKSELVIPVQENLLIRKGAGLDEISAILSHPQPLGQCRSFLTDRFPGIRIVSTYSTAGAAEEVSKGDGRSAAIGSSAAAESYGLEIAFRNIQDSDKNFTRFVAVALQDGVKTGRDKTSIAFSTEDKPGSLYRVLDILNLWDINMSRIESRPAKNQLGRYIFFVDIIGHRDDDDLKDAITMIRKKTSFFKLLGSYPAWEMDG